MATTDIVRRARAVALAAICALVVAASLVSFAESYRGLYDWAGGHGLSGIWQAAWPLMIDAFIAVGELTLFVALADGWKLRTRMGAWVASGAGLAASVAGNIGHVAGHDITVRATAAVPPLAAAAAMAVGLGVLKRVIAARAEQAAVPAADVTPPTAVSPPAVTPAPGVTQPADVTTARPRRTAVRATAKPAPAPTARARADDILRDDPDITHAALARRVGVSERTVQRWRNGDSPAEAPSAVQRLSVVHDTAEVKSEPALSEAQ